MRPPWQLEADSRQAPATSAISSKQQEPRPVAQKQVLSACLPAVFGRLRASMPPFGLLAGVPLANSWSFAFARAPWARCVCLAIPFGCSSRLYEQIKNIYWPSNCGDDVMPNGRGRAGGNISIRLSIYCHGNLKPPVFLRSELSGFPPYMKNDRQTKISVCLRLAVCLALHIRNVLRLNCTFLQLLLRKPHGLQKIWEY